MDFFKKLGPARLGAMGAMATILIGVFAFIIMRATAPQLVPLYTDLTVDDTSAIVAQLDGAGTTYELRNNGSAVYVPQAVVYQTRMSLAESGLPSGGGIGYEIFDRGDTLGATSFVQNINLLRALEGELARTIRSINQVSNARVHLVIPEKQLFQRDREPPTASIVLKVRGNLDAEQIRSIQHLVASAVEGLDPAHVSIVDERGALLASGSGEEDGVLGSAKMDERRMALENRMRTQIEDILNNVVGAGRARVRVAAELNLNSKTETQETYDPDGQVVRSSQSREEAQRNGMRDSTVSVSNLLPNAEGSNGNSGREDSSSVSDETINYEISKSTSTEVIEAGGLERLSVAVLVDGTYVTNSEGDQVYQARSQEELDSIAKLVRTAVGYDERRGDKVEVINLRFIETPSSDVFDDEPGMFDFTHEEIMRLAELGVLLVISVLMLLFAVNPLMKRILSTDESAEPQALLTGPQMETASGQVAGEAGLTSVDGGGVADGATQRTLDTASMHKEGWVDDARIQAALHSKSIQELGDMIDEMPTEAVNIVRGWINEAA
ncbi:flagellar basal-body MS-ring/collar protein FliF [Polycladidibacter stylochi]|uniref:flagellar basal-body MS-ring/collar protein FliF n=1 Tax=Polycladidibacter stylochi TaxID=1807766 RepID=UPI00308399D0